MTPEFIDIVKFSIGTTIAVLGWIAGHYFTNRRDRIAKRRDISLEHLIKAYRILADEIANRKHMDERKLEAVITDIHLFGSKDQILLAKQLADDVIKHNHFQLDPLINCLRSDLRNELELPKVDGNVSWLRFNEGTLRSTPGESGSAQP